MVEERNQNEKKSAMMPLQDAWLKGAFFFGLKTAGLGQNVATRSEWFSTMTQLCFGYY